MNNVVVIARSRDIKLSAAATGNGRLSLSFKCVDAPLWGQVHDCAPHTWEWLYRDRWKHLIYAIDELTDCCRSSNGFLHPSLSLYLSFFAYPNACGKTADLWVPFNCSVDRLSWARRRGGGKNSLFLCGQTHSAPFFKYQSSWWWI